MSATITAVSWNVEQGLNTAAAAAWVRALGPELLFWQEARREQLPDLANRLGMDGYIAVPRPGSRNDNAIFVKRGGAFVFVEEYRQDWAPWHAPANIAVKLRDSTGTPSGRQISLVSVHACYWSPEYRLTEARWCSTLAKPGWLAMVFGDWNSYRTGEGGPWDGYEDTAFVANRTYAVDGTRRTDDRPDGELLAAGYIEAGRYAAEHLGQPEALHPTAGYRAHPGRPAGAGYCIDRGYLSPELAGALTRFTVCDTPALRELSDHLPQVAEFDTERLRSILRTPAATYVPHTRPHAPSRP